MLDRHRKNSGYNCVVPSSGGKGGSFTAHILKYKHNMNPLQSQATLLEDEKFSKFSHIGGIDNILYTPNENYIEN